MAIPTKEELRPMYKDVERELGRLEGRAESMMKRAGKSGKRALSATEDTVTSRPFVSMLVVFVVGLVIGWLVDTAVRS